jgi:hypothetical protein
VVKTRSNPEKSDMTWSFELEAVLSSSSNADFLEILNTIEPQVLNFVLAVRRNTFGETLLHRALNKFNTECFITLINKVSDKVLSEALLLKDEVGNTPLHLAVQNAHSSLRLTDFIALIEKVSIDSLSAGLLVKNTQGHTPLHLAASHSNSDALLSFIEKLSADALSEALLVADNDGCTPLQIAAVNANSSGFIASMNKVNEDTFRAILAAMSIEVWDLWSKNILTAVLSRCDTVTGLSQLSNDEIGEYVRELLLDSAFDANLAGLHQKFFTNKVAFAILDRIWSRIKGGRELLPAVRLRMQLMTVLMGKPAFSLTPDEIDFFRYLKKITVEHKDKIDTLIHQHLSNRPLSAMLFSRDNHLDAAYINLLQTEAEQIPDLVFDETKELTQEISKNQILIKIIAPKDHNDFMKQLNDYHYRPALRAKISNPKYKLVHLTGEVVAYNYHSHKNKAPYTHTKKSSATLLSSSLSTPVFGQHDPNRPLVGYLFNKKDCVIKAMLRQDQGTYCHQWLTQTEEEAKNAAHLIPNYNFTDEHAFLNEINTDPSRTNEVLVKVKKEAIVAIVVARKDSNSISIAKERQKEARDKLGLDLPIVFYDSNNGVLEMVQDKLGNLAQKLKRRE